MKPLKEIIFIAEEDEIDGGYVARALDYSIITEGETWDELKKNVIDAVKCHFDKDIPQIIRLYMKKEEVISCA